MAGSERSPLLTYRLCSSTSVEEPGPGPAPGSRKLRTFLGVVVPTLLSMFSVVLFLRLGFVVGQAGLYEALGMFVVAYVIIGMTVLSVCAISTNGALDAGGAYYMISRALGPEFGGSIGIMFFLANVCGSALYILGLVEAIIDIFGVPLGQTTGGNIQVLPRSYWYELLYGTALLLVCLLVCLVGASIYAKATFLIFLIVMLVLVTVFVSFFAVGPTVVQLLLPEGNHSLAINGSFTGFRLDTLRGNLAAAYSVDYTTGRVMTFSTVFAVMFNGCTGIMAGSNMSGDLKRPSYSIPRGTIAAVLFTYLIYNLLAVTLCCTCDRVAPSTILSTAPPTSCMFGASLAGAPPAHPLLAGTPPPLFAPAVLLGRLGAEAYFGEEHVRQCMKTQGKPSPEGEVPGAPVPVAMAGLGVPRAGANILYNGTGAVQPGR